MAVWFFEPWMITFGLLFPFIGNMVILTVTGGWNKEQEEEVDDDDEESGDDGEKKSLKEKMQAMQEIALQIQVSSHASCDYLQSITLETSRISGSCSGEHKKCFQL